MPSHSQFDRLKDARPAILPSLLLCDFANLEREVHRLTEAGVRGLHLDVMDGHFVPNLTYGMPLVRAFRSLTAMPLDVHLMISEPERYAGAFVEAGADAITFHIEAVDDPRPLLDELAELGIARGLALNPDTPLGSVEPYLEGCDLLLVMSVNAGFGGQKFNPIALEKLRHIREHGPRDLLLEVDGGINTSTLASCAQAGADLFVVGSAIFQQPDYGAAVAELKGLANSNSQRQA